MALNIHKHYFTYDGTYGDSNALIVINTRNFTPEEWDWIEGCSDSDRQRMAITCFVRSFYRIANESESGLPCEHCHFVDESDIDCGYAWMGCGADKSNGDIGDGCDWGNR